MWCFSLDVRVRLKLLDNNAAVSVNFSLKLSEQVLTTKNMIHKLFPAVILIESKRKQVKTSCTIYLVSWQNVVNFCLCWSVFGSVIVFTRASYTTYWHYPCSWTNHTAPLIFAIVQPWFESITQCLFCIKCWKYMCICTVGSPPQRVLQRKRSENEKSEEKWKRKKIGVQVSAWGRKTEILCEWESMYSTFYLHLKFVLQMSGDLNYLIIRTGFTPKDVAPVQSFTSSHVYTSKLYSPWCKLQAFILSVTDISCK